LYLSAMLIIAVYYRFRRIWSLRNFDLILLLSLSPGLLLVRNDARGMLGNTWLFIVTAFCLARLLFDGFFSKRSRLESNLSTAGIRFLGCCALAFLLTEAITRPAPPGTVSTVMQGEKILEAATNSQRPPQNPQQAPDPSGAHSSDDVTAGPAASILAMPAVATSRQLVGANVRVNDPSSFGIVHETAARILAMLAHLAIVSGLYWIGRSLFKDAAQGTAMATLYLLIPATSYVVGEVNQVLPCAFLVWAFACYAYPFWAGILMGCACGSMFFPVFILPVWASFFGWKRSLRFFAGVILVGALLAGSIALITPDAYAFTQQTIHRIDFRVLSFDGAPNQQGFWTGVHPAYRVPVIVAFLLLVISLTIWPRKKNLEVLLSSSAAIIVATQFWYPQLGGLYLLWYLPLLILVVFRPRLLAEADFSSTDQQQSLRSPEYVNGSGRETPASSASAKLYR
ncbi:MAG: hypothetical protein KDA78_04300, partial [Planctomycetaceae bacterium]|nr:hypothetical protein [Planctomycetaceae bacterium]